MERPPVANATQPCGKLTAKLLHMFSDAGADERWSRRSLRLIPGHCALIPTALTTFAESAISLSTNCLNSEGVIGIGATTRPARAGRSSRSERLGS